MKKLILIVLSAALLLSACGQATEAAPAEEPVTASTVTTAETASSPKTTPNGVDKAETVYAKANADGTVTETTVEVTLKAQDGQTIPDAAALRDITNKEGDEDYTCGADNGLTWQNHGTSITYEGKSDAALPVTTRVTYYLDGQEIAPGALADGSAQLNDASAGLYSGLTELHDGAAALRDGVQEFSKKAGKERGDDFGDGLQNVVRRLKAVQQAGKAYQTFTGLADGMTGNVKFIVETAEIK